MKTLAASCLALALLGCGRRVNRPAACVPNATASCACRGAPNGVQTCQSDGTFGSCECAPPVVARVDDPSKPPPVVPSPEAPAQPAAEPVTVAQPGDELVGNYGCSFQTVDDGTQYPPMSCVISRRPSGGLWLEKTSGSQRIRGTVILTASGFRFSGSRYCPFGTCNSPASGTFTRRGETSLAGVVTYGPSQGGGDRVVLTRRGTGGQPTTGTRRPSTGREPDLGDLGL